ncbi:MAG: ECF transporter S component [Mycobacteriales bacterium]
MSAESRVEGPPVEAPPVEAPPAVPAGRPAIRFRGRSALALTTLSALGVVAFGWPLLVPTLAAGDTLGHTRDASWLFVVLLPLLLGVVLAELADGGMDAKAVAMLGVLTACGAALRPLGGGFTGVTPVFLLLILAGRVLGRGFGFVLGALTLFASAMLTGGVGPWLPFQMLGAGWVGFFAGCLPPARGRWEVAMLAAYGVVAGLVYGLLLNLWFWPFGAGTPVGSGLAFDPNAGLVLNLRHFLAFDLATSLGFDVPRAVTNFLLVLVAGRPVLLALRRAARRAAFDAPVEFR